MGLRTWDCDSAEEDRASDVVPELEDQSSEDDQDFDDLPELEAVGTQTGLRPFENFSPVFHMWTGNREDMRIGNAHRTQGSTHALRQSEMTWELASMDNEVSALWTRLGEFQRQIAAYRNRFETIIREGHPMDEGSRKTSKNRHNRRKLDAAEARPLSKRGQLVTSCKKHLKGERVFSSRISEKN